MSARAKKPQERALRAEGFQKGVHYTPVPSPLLGRMLVEIDDAGELRCTLRAIGLLHATVRRPRWIAESDLLDDEVLLESLGSRAAVAAALESAADRGTLLKPSGRVMLNNAEGRATAERVAGDERPSAGVATPAGAGPRANIFALYEDNIGALSPMIADELRRAEEDYPSDWVEEAFREAVMANARSWRYVRAILERWSSEGRGGHSAGTRGARGESRGRIKEVRTKPGSRY